MACASCPFRRCCPPSSMSACAAGSVLVACSRWHASTVSSAAAAASWPRPSSDRIRVRALPTRAVARAALPQCTQSPSVAPSRSTTRRSFSRQHHIFVSTQELKSSRHSAARSSPASSAAAACSPSCAKCRAARSACVRAAAMSHSLSDCIQCADETKRSGARGEPVLARLTSHCPLPAGGAALLLPPCSWCSPSLPSAAGRPGCWMSTCMSGFQQLMQVLAAATGVASSGTVLPPAASPPPPPPPPPPPSPPCIRRGRSSSTAAASSPPRPVVVAPPQIASRSPESAPPGSRLITASSV
mmetsp:Transcript_14852/g.35106  ORF Transcript_14852/g.35106 Transcript_14852/m.35106 type:complete len:300 (-) Transcript_14852:640-1539(-)